MNKTVAWFFCGLLGLLLVLSLSINKWINKELVETVKPSTGAIKRNLQLEKTSAFVEEYDPDSDYAFSPPVTNQDIVPVVKKSERVLDKKIIYEMPTSNKYLLQ